MQDAFDCLPTTNDPQFPGGFDRFDYPQQAFHDQPSQQQHQHQHHHTTAFSATAPPGPPTPPAQSAFSQQQPPRQPAAAATNGAFNGIDHQMPGDVNAQAKSNSDDLSNGREGSEDDNLTPAQSKRKAQNRAAYVSHPPVPANLRERAEKQESNANNPRVPQTTSLP